MLQENLNLDLENGVTSPIIFKVELDPASQAIDDRAMTRAKKYLAAEAEMLSSIMEVDLHKTYEKFGYTHLTPYCVKHLGLSEDVAGNFVRVACMSQVVPELKSAIDQGHLSVSKAKTIAPVVNAKNQDDWIKKAQELTRDQLQREVAKVSPFAAKIEKAKPIGTSEVWVEFGLAESQMNEFRRAQNIVNQKLQKAASLGETFEQLLKCYLDHHDPLRKAERSAKRKDRRKSSGKSEVNKSRSRKADPSGVRVNSKRKALPGKLVHAINLRDKGKCQAMLHNGNICGHDRWTHFHHIIPVAKGGKDVLNNMITLCSSHHRIWHERESDRAES